MASGVLIHQTRKVVNRSNTKLPSFVADPPCGSANLRLDSFFFMCCSEPMHVHEAGCAIDADDQQDEAVYGNSFVIVVQQMALETSALR